MSGLTVLPSLAPGPIIPRDLTGTASGSSLRSALRAFAYGSAVVPFLSDLADSSLPSTAAFTGTGSSLRFFYLRALYEGVTMALAGRFANEVRAISALSLEEVGAGVRDAYLALSPAPRSVEAVGSDMLRAWSARLSDESGGAEVAKAMDAVQLQEVDAVALRPLAQVLQSLGLRCAAAPNEQGEPSAFVGPGVTLQLSSRRMVAHWQSQVSITTVPGLLGHSAGLLIERRRDLFRQHWPRHLLAELDPSDLQLLASALGGGDSVPLAGAAAFLASLPSDPSIPAALPPAPTISPASNAVAADASARSWGRAVVEAAAASQRAGGAAIGKTADSGAAGSSSGEDFRRRPRRGTKKKKKKSQHRSRRGGSDASGSSEEESFSGEVEGSSGESSSPGRAAGRKTLSRHQRAAYKRGSQSLRTLLMSHRFKLAEKKQMEQLLLLGQFESMRHQQGNSFNEINYH